MRVSKEELLNPTRFSPRGEWRVLTNRFRRLLSNGVGQTVVIAIHQHTLFRKGMTIPAQNRSVT